MLITEKQLLILIDVLKDSLCIVGHFCIPKQQRIDLYSAILNQQSDKLKEIKE
jgi:hypothetical protein